jgi:hypothetical protein
MQGSCALTRVRTIRLALAFSSDRELFGTRPGTLGRRRVVRHHPPPASSYLITLARS